MKKLSNPAYLAGKLAYLQGIPENAIRHVTNPARSAWLDGYRDIQGELMSVRSQAKRVRRDILSKPGNFVLQQLPRLPADT